MLFTEIGAYPVRPGELRNWVPTADREPALWERDWRRPAHVHFEHLAQARAIARRRHIDGGRESWLGLAVEFHEPLSIPGLRTALQEWIDRHEVLRTHVLLHEDDHPQGSGELDAQRRSLPPGGVTITVRTVGSYHSTGPLTEQLLGEFDRTTAPLNWPAYTFATVSRDDSFTLYFAADHSLVDGYSLILSPHELRELYRQAVHGDAPHLLSVGSYVDYSHTERTLAEAAADDHPAVAMWREFLDETAFEPAAFPMPLLPPNAKMLANETLAALTLDPEGVPRLAQRGLNFHLLDDERANNFTRVCSESGASLVTGILACMAKINTDLGFGPVFRCTVTRHTRDAPHWLAAVGWFVGLAPFRLDTTGSRSFGELAQRAQQQWRHLKPGSTLPYLRIGELLDGRAPQPRFVVSFIDTRFAPGAADNDAGGAGALRSRDYSLDDVYLWVLRTPTGVHVAVRFPGFDTALRSLTLYLGAVRSMMTEIGDSSVARP